MNRIYHQKLWINSNLTCFRFHDRCDAWRCSNRFAIVKANLVSSSAHERLIKRHRIHDEKCNREWLCCWQRRWFADVSKMNMMNERRWKIGFLFNECSNSRCRWLKHVSRHQVRLWDRLDFSLFHDKGFKRALELSQIFMIEFLLRSTDFYQCYIGNWWDVMMRIVKKRSWASCVQLLNFVIVKQRAMIGTFQWLFPIHQVLMKLIGNLCDFVVMFRFVPFNENFRIHLDDKKMYSESSKRMQ